MNTTIPPQTARPALGWTMATVELATPPQRPLPHFEGWKQGRAVVHRHTDNARRYVGAIVLGRRAWRVLDGTAAQMKVWGPRVEAALAELTDDDLYDLDNTVGRGGGPALNKLRVLMAKHRALVHDN